MAFGEAFGGYCVIHAPFAAPERRVQFERALAGIGVTNYVVIEALPVAADDPRLVGPMRVGELSLIDAARRAIELARRQGWPSLLVFEDDIIFRRDFRKRWQQVETEVLSSRWDVITLYRRPRLNGPPSEPTVTIERPQQRTRLLPIPFSYGTHAIAFSAAGYERALAGLDRLVAIGRPFDYLIPQVLHLGGRCFATSHNIVGQTSTTGTSTISHAVRRRRAFRVSWSHFGSYRSRTAYVGAAAARVVLRLRQRVRLAWARSRMG